MKIAERNLTEKVIEEHAEKQTRFGDNLLEESNNLESITRRFTKSDEIFSISSMLDKAFLMPEYQGVKRGLEYFIYSNSKDIYSAIVNRDDFNFDSSHINYGAMTYFVSKMFDECKLASVDTATESRLQKDLCRELWENLDSDDSVHDDGKKWAERKGADFRLFYHEVIKHFFSKESEFYIDLMITCANPYESCGDDLKSLYNSFFSKHTKRCEDLGEVKDDMINDMNGIVHDSSMDKHIDGSISFNMPEFNVRKNGRAYMDVRVMNRYGLHVRPSIDILSLMKSYQGKTSFIIDGVENDIRENPIDIISLGLKQGKELTVVASFDDSDSSVDDYMKGIYEVFARTSDYYPRENLS